MTASLTATEFNARSTLWKALADFWLDTELQDFQLNYIARVIVASPYTLNQARAIHNREVAPVLWRNMANVAGEWAGFDDTWLVARCEEQMVKSKSLSTRARNWLLLPTIWFFTAGYWRQVVRRVNAQQDIQPDGPASGGSAS